MSGYVYFIACEPLEAVKIGFTRSSPTTRLSALQTGCPAPLRLLAYFPGTLDDERRLHDAFRPLNIHLEWFRYEAKLWDFVTYISHEESGSQTSRTAFENALHDVLMQGLWYPDSGVTEEEYLATGDWEPFRELLVELEGPWEE